MAGIGMCAIPAILFHLTILIQNFTYRLFLTSQKLPHHCFDKARAAVIVIIIARRIRAKHFDGFPRRVRTPVGSCGGQRDGVGSGGLKCVDDLLDGFFSSTIAALPGGGYRFTEARLLLEARGSLLQGR